MRPPLMQHIAASSFSLFFILWLIFFSVARPSHSLSVPATRLHLLCSSLGQRAIYPGPADREQVQHQHRSHSRHASQVSGGSLPSLCTGGRRLIQLFSVDERLRSSTYNPRACGPFFFFFFSGGCILLSMWSVVFMLMVVTRTLQ